jgi:hypothetical protein
MKVELKEISVRELTEGYRDNEEEGVVGYSGQLDIRPPYQREFVYDDEQRNAVINTLSMGFPLNIMYWAVRDDGGFEIIDGQQRTISICQFVSKRFSTKIFDVEEPRFFQGLQDDEKQRILDYELMVYFCSGEKSEKLSWFRTVNIAGEPLTNQELKNAVFAGPWVTDAKRYFSKKAGPAFGLASDYLKGDPQRQKYLETAIDWISEGNIADYMGEHQENPNANELWLYFQRVISWVEATFPKKRSPMKSVPWGRLYGRFSDCVLDSAKLEKQVAALMEDEEVQRKPGIYSFVLDGDERHLNIRAFSQNQKREAYERQNGICATCGGQFLFEQMEGDHITPWHEGGKTENANCQMLCRDCNRKKGGT